MKPLYTALVAFWLANVPEIRSCECASTGPADCFKYADVIFEGQVEAMQIRTHPLFSGLKLDKKTLTTYCVFVLNVSRIFKGSLPTSVRIATGIGTADGTAAPDCSFPFEIGGRYLVYGHKNISEYGGLIYRSTCSGTERLAEAGQYLRRMVPSSS